MKTVKLFIVLSFVAFSLNGFAQKIAVISLDSLLSIMPETAVAKQSSSDFIKQLESQMQVMKTELDSKLADYQTNQNKYTDLIKQTKEKELQDLNTRIQSFQQNAQLEIQKKNEELTRPINDKAKKAIEKVAKAKGFKLVVDTSVGSILYSEPADDIFSFVKAELGLK